MITLTLISRYVLPEHHLVINVSKQGHMFITFVVSFLLLSRVNTGLARYNTARDCLSTMYRESRDLIQGVCVLSADNTDQEAKEWRHEVAYRCLILLRTTMAVVDYPTDQIPAWAIPELNGSELDDVKENVFVPVTDTTTTSNVQRWAHKPHDAWEETKRVPVRLEYLLQNSLHSQSRRLKKPIHVTQEIRLLASVGSFMTGYYGICKFLTTVRYDLARFCGFFIC
jgi:hypothetical protein